MLMSLNCFMASPSSKSCARSRGLLHARGRIESSPLAGARSVRRDVHSRLASEASSPGLLVPSGLLSLLTDRFDDPDRVERGPLCDERGLAARGGVEDEEADLVFG